MIKNPDFEKKVRRAPNGEFIDKPGAGSSGVALSTTMSAAEELRARCNIPDEDYFTHIDYTEPDTDRAPDGDKIQEVEIVAPGILFCPTDGHGFFKLCSERNKYIPSVLRKRSGWYEEDCERNIVGSFYPEAMSNGTQASPEEYFESSLEGLRRYYPDAYEKVTGDKVLPGQSKIRDAALFKEANKDEYMMSYYISSTATDIQAEITRASDGDTKIVTFPRSAIKDQQFGHTVVDITQVQDFNPDEGITFYNDATLREKLTDKQRQRCENELGYYWRDEDGSRGSLRSMIEAGKFFGKVAYGDSKRNYYLQRRYKGTTTLFPVSKTLYDALEGIPEGEK